jgi:NitT/TauT family transport system ATP-binding protein
MKQIKAFTPLLEIHDLSFKFSTQLIIFKDISFSIQSGEFLSIIGQSGSGKTTLLKCISGILNPFQGKIIIREKSNVEKTGRVTLVFQDYSRSLFPWLTVHANVLFAIDKKKLPSKKKKEIASEMLKSVGLKPYENFYPWQLSGGMQQRVALARALAYSPDILLLDEPFASVDSLTRIDLENLLLSLWDQYRFSVIFVTHDVDEAIFLSDRILILEGTPAKIKEEIQIPITRPRDAIHVKESVEFAKIRTLIYNIMRNKG